MTKTKGSVWVTGSIVLCLAGGMISCAASPNETASVEPAVSGDSPSLVAEEKLPNELSPSSQKSDAQTSSVPTQAPQLIKTAHVTLRVKEVNQSLDRIVGNILNQQRGDVLNLEVQEPQGAGDRHRASLQMRVPQQNLNSTLKALEELGTVAKRSIQAQDVSNQIVDSQARLKNLRKSEEMVLKIMDRSGSIPDVLSASQELSKIRENVERIDAQLQNLQAQVAFSTINLQLEAVTTSIQPESGIGLQVQEAWKRSTNAMGNLTMAFIKLGVWGIAFSPYLIAIALLIWLGRRQLQKGSELRPKDLNAPQISPTETP